MINIAGVTLLAYRAWFSSYTYLCDASTLADAENLRCAIFCSAFAASDWYSK